jgi:hypothetical protein
MAYIPFDGRLVILLIIYMPISAISAVNNGIIHRMADQSVNESRINLILKTFNRLGPQHKKGCSIPGTAF